MEKIPSISLKQNFTPNTLGCYVLRTFSEGHLTDSVYGPSPPLKFGTVYSCSVCDWENRYFRQDNLLFEWFISAISWRATKTVASVAASDVEAVLIRCSTGVRFRRIAFVDICSCHKNTSISISTGTRQQNKLYWYNLDKFCHLLPACIRGDTGKKNSRVGLRNDPDKLSCYLWIARTRWHLRKSWNHKHSLNFVELSKIHIRLRQNRIWSKRYIFHNRADFFSGARRITGRFTQSVLPKSIQPQAI